MLHIMYLWILAWWHMCLGILGIADRGFSVCCCTIECDPEHLLGNLFTHTVPRLTRFFSFCGKNEYQPYS